LEELTRNEKYIDYGNIRNYQSALTLVEIFDLTRELQAHLINLLCTLLLTEPDARQAQILSQSPGDERQIRSEVYESKRKLSSTRFDFHFACLRYFIQDVQQYGLSRV